MLKIKLEMPKDLETFDIDKDLEKHLKFQIRKMDKHLWQAFKEEFGLTLRAFKRVTRKKKTKNDHIFWADHQGVNLAKMTANPFEKSSLEGVKKRRRKQVKITKGIMKGKMLEKRFFKGNFSVNSEREDRVLTPEKIDEVLKKSLDKNLDRIMNDAAD